VLREKVGMGVRMCVLVDDGKKNYDYNSAKFSTFIFGDGGRRIFF